MMKLGFKIKLFFELVLLITFAMFIGGCRTSSSKEYINYISFSHDGKKILFDRRNGEGPYLINVFDLETGELSAYQPPPNERWTMARYSFDGKHIVFSIYPRGKKGLERDNMQLAVMDPDGKNVKRITNSHGTRIFPSFSHSGGTVLFANAGKIRTKGRTPAADYDFYEVNIKTGIETRLTWFKFFEVTSPSFFPDDERIIFSAYAQPGIYPGIDETDHESIRKKQEERQALEKMRGRISYQDDTYIINKGQRTLPEPLVWDKDGNRKPLISDDGKRIFFTGWARKPDNSGGEGEQYYRYSLDGKHRRVTYITPPSGIRDAALSPDGKYLAVVVSKVRILICNTIDGTSRTINLPDQPSHIINQQMYPIKIDSYD